jgi:hypothetical protein
LRYWASKGFWFHAGSDEIALAFIVGTLLRERKKPLETSWAPV